MRLSACPLRSGSRPPVVAIAISKAAAMILTVVMTVILLIPFKLHAD